MLISEEQGRLECQRFYFVLLESRQIVHSHIIINIINDQNNETHEFYFTTVRISCFVLDTITLILKNVNRIFIFICLLGISVVINVVLVQAIEYMFPARNKVKLLFIAHTEDLQSRMFI